MIPTFVADASVAVGWVHPAQATKDTAAMLASLNEGTLVEVPSLWPLEVSNALLVLVRRGQLAEDRRQIALRWLSDLAVRIDHDGISLGFTMLSELATAHNISVYDAAYLELAQRRDVPLGCRDGHLRRAARRAGIALWS